LTDKGLEDFEKVIEAVFKYSQNIRNLGPQEYIFEEMQALGCASFEFQEKSDPMSTCINFSMYLQQLDESNVNKIIESQYVVEEFDTQRFNEIADILVSPQKMNVLIGSKKFEGSDEIDQVADWFLTPYST